MSVERSAAELAEMDKKRKWQAIRRYALQIVIVVAVFGGLIYGIRNAGKTWRIVFAVILAGLVLWVLWIAFFALSYHGKLDFLKEKPAADSGKKPILDNSDPIPIP